MSDRRSVTLARRGDAFPFSVPSIRTLPELSFDRRLFRIHGQAPLSPQSQLALMALMSDPQQFPRHLSS